MAVARFKIRWGHPTLDLTASRVRQQASTYRFARLGLLIDGTLEPEDNLVEVVHYLERGRPVGARAWARPDHSAGESGPRAPDVAASRVPLEQANAATGASDAASGCSARDEWQLSEARMSDSALHDLYVARSKRGRAGFLVPGVPVYFLVEPRAGRTFDVEIDPSGDAFTPKSVQRAFATYGLDFASFCRERIELLQASGHMLANQRLIRHTGIAFPDGPSVLLRIASCSFVDYACTEGAINLLSPRIPVDARQLFEGERWVRHAVDLVDVGYTCRRFAAAVSVSVLVTTADRLLVLQRRSGKVSQGAGNITAAVSGFTSWTADLAHAHEQPAERAGPGPQGGALRATVLRELVEELNVGPDDLWSVERPFLGAGYNLLHGRDLNFYAHVHAKLSRSEIEARLRQARDRWEVAELLFVPLACVADDGALVGAFADALPECTRHLRAALYALAKSGVLERCRSEP